ASLAALAGDGGGPVPLLRHRQATAGAQRRGGLQGRLRRDGRRHRGGRLCIAGAGRTGEAVRMNGHDEALVKLAAEVGAWLRERGWMLATAESCTGGWIST